MPNDTTRQVYDQQQRRTGGKGTRQEMGQVRQADFRRPKDQTGLPPVDKK